jgi:hypothetical protein
MNRYAVSLLAAACLALPANAQDITPFQKGGAARAQIAQASPGSTSGIGADIIMLRVAGPWQSGGQRGVSRLIATGSGGRIGLSVEWIADTGAIVSALPLAVPPGAEHVPLARVHNETGGGESVVYFDTPDGDSFVLMVGAPGVAKFGPASN